MNGMDPSMMQAAMEAMGKMGPEQMQQMMSSMTPEMMAQAQAMASRMSPAEMQAALEQTKQMSPEDMKRAAAAATTNLSAQQRYTITASTQLKNEGNQLHGAGKYKEAVEKYERALSNVQALAGAEAQELAKACSLNLSSCYLNLGHWDLCVTQCAKVLAGEPDSLKALYRRGQAYMGCKQWVLAVDDLAQAVKLSSHDPAQQRLIKEKLQEAKDQVSVQRAAGASSQPAAGAEAAPASSSEPTPSTSTPAAQAARQPSGAAAAALPPGMDPGMMQAATDMMRSNPDWHKQMSGMLAGMSDADIMRMSQGMGQTIRPDQVAAARQRFAAMDPSSMEQMAALQSAVPVDLQQRLAANPHDPVAVAEAAKLLKQNPSMASAAASMFEKMTPEQLDEMAVQTGMPRGMLSPEMAKQAAATFAALSPEELERMASMAQSMQPPRPVPPASATAAAPAAAASSSGRTAGTAQPSSSRAVEAAAGGAVGQSAAASSGMPAGMPGGLQMTPEMARMAADMMASMPPEQLQAMTAGLGGPAAGRAAGMGGMPAFTPEMAKMAADMMRNMSPEDMQRMSSMMGSGGMPGMAGMGMPSAAGGLPAGMPGADMLGNPAMMETAMKMMKDMDAGSLTSMLQATGMVKSQAQAEAMAQQMKGMSDTQMKLLMRAAGVAHTGGRMLAKAKEVLTGRAWLIAAICVLLLALLLRVLGAM